MKSKIIVILSLAVLLCACDTVELLKSKHNTFTIFRFVDESYKELIITYDDTTSYAADVLINGIYNFPKFTKDEPYFIDSEDKNYNLEDYQEKHTYDICELATGEKVFALHDNYYAVFPYMNIHGYDPKCSIRNGKWTDICDVNPLKLHIMGEGASMYKDIHVFEGLALDKITKKKRYEMTFEDIVHAVNKVIDDGELDKYSTQYHD